MSFREPAPRPFLKWVGGKRQLLPALLQAVDSTGSFADYHEPFLGGGALFFALSRSGRLSGRSHLSDVNQNLMDAYVGVRDHASAIVRLLKKHRKQHCEEYFYDVRAAVPRNLPGRAARVIYLNKTCFNGLYRENSKGKFNAPFGRYKNPAIFDEENLHAVSDTLQLASLSAQPFTGVLDNAKRGDLVYFDPPYAPVSRTADFTSYAKGGFGLREQKELADVATVLVNRGVRVILSNSLTDVTRELYRDFYVYRVFASRRVNSRADRRGKVAEVLATSFPLVVGYATGDEKTNGAVLINGKSGGLEKMLARQWLLENGYEDIATLIDEVTDEWKAQGKRTRRNWWEVLAGDKHGNSRHVEGREFPVLKAAQLRQGFSVTESALRRNPSEEPPAVRITGRWAEVKSKEA